MKSRFCLFLPLLIILGLSSCASAPVAESGVLSEAQDVYKEKKQNHKKLLFEDWKYKGFGQALPVWFEAAYRGDVEEVRRKITVSDNYEIKIVTAQGINSDQANKSLWQKLVVKAELFELYDSSWALFRKEKSGTYIAIAVFYN